MTVDILLAVAEKGGVENIINMVAPYLQNQRKWKIRIVQLVFEGTYWAEADIPFYHLLWGREGHTLEEFVKAYADFMKDRGAPDVVLATAWPYMCYVGKKALAVIAKRDTKLIAWQHAPVEKYEAAGYGGYSYLALADSYIAISKELQDGLVKNFPEKLVVSVRNPVDFKKCAVHDRISICAEKGHSNSKRKLVYVGRIAEEKRLDIIIQAMRAVYDTWELWIIGDGETTLTKNLKILVKQCGVERSISWLGWKENPWDYAVSADALVLASEFEGFPLVAIEALANGIPVISTPVSGITELIVPGENGYIFPQGDSEFLANILNMMSAGKLPAIQAERCRKSVQWYDRYFSIPDFASKIAEMAEHQKEMLLTKAGERFTYREDIISVIIPCYNVAAYIEECIESLLASTLPLDMLEFIFVDDASTDDTIEKIQKYEKQYPENILLIKCDRNRKQGAARNLGMSYARGNYIAFVDGDDKIHPQMLQKLYEKVALYGCDISGCGYTVFDEAGTREKSVSNEKLYLFDKFERGRENRKEYIVKFGCKNAVWSRMYRRQFLTDNEIYFPENIYMEDLYFHQICMMTAKSCYELAESLYFYRSNPDSVMNRVNKEYFLDTFAAQEQAYCAMKERGFTEGYEEELALIYYVKAFVETTYRMLEGVNGIEWDEAIFETIKTAIRSHFPKITENPYIRQDKSEWNQKYFMLLKKNEMVREKS